MKKEIHQQATSLMNERSNIQAELTIWDQELTTPAKLGYLQGWNNNHATKLDTKIPIEVFNGFRTASINALKVRLFEIDEEYTEL